MVVVGDRCRVVGMAGVSMPGADSKPGAGTVGTGSERSSCRSSTGSLLRFCPPHLPNKGNLSVVSPLQIHTHREAQK